MLSCKQVEYLGTQNNKMGILVGDIGGTNSNFGIAQMVDDELTLVRSLHIKSKEIINFSIVINDILAYLLQTYGITITDACFAVAGIITPGQTWCKPTNLNITIDTQDIKKITGLNTVTLVNDFEIIGYGIKKIKPHDIIMVQQGQEYPRGNKAILGAGTGLGKALICWVESKDRYISVASEGGHADFAAQTQQDIDLINYIKTSEQISENISWEHLLSGNGIGRIFNFLSSNAKNDNNTTVTAPVPDEIFKDKALSATHQKTAELYAKIYGRCAKNWALDTLSWGGVYITGGIAAHNVDLFKLPEFLIEFTQCDKQRNFLQSVPIWVIADYNVSLYGAIEYMRSEGKCNLL